MNEFWPFTGGSLVSPYGKPAVGCRGATEKSVEEGTAVWLEERARERALRYDVFSPEVVNDPSWTILQELYRAELQKKHISIEQLADAATLEPSTVARYLTHLAEHELIRDQGLAPQLSEHGKRKLRSYFSSLFRRSSL